VQGLGRWPERPQSVSVFRRALLNAPDVIAGQVHALPAAGRQMSQQVIGDILDSALRGDNVLQISRVVALQLNCNATVRLGTYREARGPAPRCNVAQRCGTKSTSANVPAWTHLFARRTRLGTASNANSLIGLDNSHCFALEVTLRHEGVRIFLALNAKGLNQNNRVNHLVFAVRWCSSTHHGSWRA
jgi:hypothetical protein